MNNKSFLNQNILIVGGAGFVGSNLCLKLIEESPNKIIIVEIFEKKKQEIASNKITKKANLEIFISSIFFPTQINIKLLARVADA